MGRGNRDSHHDSCRRRSPQMIRTYLDDISVGDTSVSRTRTITEADIVQFAMFTDGCTQFTLTWSMRRANLASGSESPTVPWSSPLALGWSTSGRPLCRPSTAGPAQASPQRPRRNTTGLWPWRTGLSCSTSPRTSRPSFRGSSCRARSSWTRVFTSGTRRPPRQGE